MDFEGVNDGYKGIVAFAAVTFWASHDYKGLYRPFCYYDVVLGFLQQ